MNPCRRTGLERLARRFCLQRGRLCSHLPALFLAVLLAGCASQGPPEAVVVGENDHVKVVVAGRRDDAATLAERFLGDAKAAWRIEDANDPATIRPGQHVVIPVQETNPVGVFADGYQTVPILSYHRFGAGKGKLSVSRQQFEAQMAYLRAQGYRVIPLTQLLGFLRGEASVPRRAVVLTIDDGYRSVYEVAYPILQKYGFPATVFIYSDYISNGGLSWRQMQEMEASGLISFQAHSKTHANLTLSHDAESLAQYKARLSDEIALPQQVLDKRMRMPVFGYAYPFGAVNRPVADEIKRQGYALGLTVNRGGNAFFSYPYTLHRTMIYESDDLRAFERALTVFESRAL